jgi:hypothetical protein
MCKRLLFLMIVAGFAAGVKGDGKFFVREKIPAGIPYQRAILLFHEDHETLILQSKYDLPESQSVDSLAWIVPVPTVPEIAGGGANVAQDCFFVASRQTQPNVYHISYLFSLVCLVLFVGGLAFMTVFLIRYPRARRAESTRAVWNRQMTKTLLATGIAFLLMTSSMPTLSRARGSAGIDVIKAEHAGIYDVKVVRAQDAEAITEWLRENSFGVSDQDGEVFGDYVRRGWCFVTAKVEPNAPTEERKVISEGMVAPLLLKFASERPVYPLALTATAGTETEILLYTLSDAKLTCGERLTLRNARQTKTEFILRSLVAQAEVEEWSLLRNLPETPVMLCKFTGRLTSAQMKQDLEFTPAPDNEPYRERFVTW